MNIPEQQSDVPATEKSEPSTVLVVDDEPLVLSSLRRLLRPEFEVLTARTAEEGLALLPDYDVHVIISDQRLPGLSGAKMLARARSAYPDAIRVLLTGYADLQSIVEAVNSGRIHRYVSKPWNPDEMLAIVRDAAERYRMTARTRDLYATLVAAREELERRVAERTAELEAANARLQEIQAALREQAIRDPLTGLFNRRYLDETIPREMARAKRAGASIGVLMVDIDYFKRINDTHGHPAGDKVLRSVAAVLRSGIRAEDIACRYGGEEFVLVLPGMARAVVSRRAEQLRARVAALSVSLGDSVARPTISIGGAIWPEHSSTFASVIARADAELYQAKRAGRDRVIIADAGGEAPPPKKEDQT
jgi:diguanylate cyclase (GGDEF)-like protein